MSKITARERILIEIIQSAYSAQLNMSMRADLTTQAKKYDFFDGRVHFGGYDSQIESGDVVFCHTSKPWVGKVAVVDTVISDSECLIRPVGSDYLVRMYNESFIKLENAPDEYRWLDKHFEFRRKTMKAIYRGNKYFLSFRGIKFDDNKVIIFFAKKWDENVLELRMSWNQKTTIKLIRSKIEEVYRGED